MYVDELWEADAAWPHYFIDGRVWVYADEYRAELPGDEDYSRIVIHAGQERGWVYSRRLCERAKVSRVLNTIDRPVSERQLSSMGFKPWTGTWL